MKEYNSLKEMYESDEYQAYISDRLGNDLFINDPVRAERIHEAAESGSDGSYHYEVINDWQDFLNSLRIYDPEFDEEENCDLTEEQFDTIQKEITECYEWHQKNGSLYQQLS